MGSLKKQVEDLITLTLENYPDLTEVHTAYWGSGDSGEVQDVNGWGAKGKSQDLDASLEGEYQALAYDVLEQEHPGWEINEGSEGSMIVDLINRKVTLSHADIQPVYTQDEEVEL